MKGRIHMKKVLAVICLVSIIMNLQIDTVLADTGYYTGSTDNHTRKNESLIGVTDEMKKPDYWLDKSIEDSDKVLADKEAIAATNKQIVEISNNNVVDMENAFDTEFNADTIRNSLSKAAIPSQLYRGSEAIDNNTYFTAIKEAIANTGYTGMQAPIYAVCTGRVDMKDWPTNEQLVYIPNDYDDDLQSSAMNANEPFIIRAKCEIGGQIYYWGYSIICSGWVSGENIAICASKEEWLESWKIDLNKDDYVVVTGSKINLEKESAKTVQIMLGTYLKLVPESEIPADLKEKCADNYIAYLPSKAADGKFVKQIAVLSKSLEINQGLLPYTECNVLDLAFACLGDTYGWGCANGDMDCSGYVRQIYRCFGYELARNTTWQQLLPGCAIDIREMSDEQRKQFFSTLPTGTALYFSGHTMIYLGNENGVYYVISDLGSVYDIDQTLKNIRAVTVNSLDVLRGNKRTWLNNLVGIVNLADKIDLSKCSITLSQDQYIYDGEAKVPAVEVLYNGAVLFSDINYTLEYADNTEIGDASVIIKGINNVAGEQTVKFAIEEKKPEVVPEEEKPANEVVPDKTTANDTPVTGDDGLMYIYAIASLLSLGTFIISLKDKKRC